MAKTKRKKRIGKRTCTIVDFGGGHVIINGVCASPRRMKKIKRLFARKSR